MMMKNCLEAQYEVLMSSFTFLTGRSLLNGLCDDYWSPVARAGEKDRRGKVKVRIKVFPVTGLTSD